ncbi:MAG TPA: hypothetical protein VEQ85_10030 [Lacipirellulaceae bacterium]|nr:hypothetical protein [Lacipirellulaceae bacterium]
MGIPVTCPHGHHFNVKDKYAGKKGICPYCEGQVVVRVPDPNLPQNLKQAVSRAVREDRKSPAPAGTGSGGDASVFDNATDEKSGSGASSGSLLGSSVVRHNIRCPCGESVPMWFAKCPKCGAFIEHF